METMGRREPTDAFVLGARDSNTIPRQEALDHYIYIFIYIYILMPARLEPASHAHAHAQLADVVVAMLEDEDDRVRERALATLGKQDPATLAQHVGTS